MRTSVRMGSIILPAALLLLPACGGKKWKRLDDQNKQILKQLDEMRATIEGMDKRLVMRTAMSSGGGTRSVDSESAPVTVSALVADPLVYSGRVVQLEAYLASAVDKERAFFVVLGKPRDVMNNVGVYYDPDDIATKRDVHLADPGDKLMIEGQLAVDKEANGYKTYSGYALKAKSVRKAP